MTDQPEDLHAYGDREYATDQFVQLKRIEILRGRLVAELRDAKPITLTAWDTLTNSYLTQQTQLAPRSLMLCVAQYWSDQADDEVHLWLLASTGTIPNWPHTCADPRTTNAIVDVCPSCSHRERWLHWGYRELFEAWAIEGAHPSSSAWSSRRPPRSTPTSRRSPSGAPRGHARRR